VQKAGSPAEFINKLSGNQEMCILNINTDFKKNSDERFFVSVYFFRQEYSNTVTFECTDIHTVLEFFEDDIVRVPPPN
jgi:hypothetical protein